MVGWSNARYATEDWEDILAMYDMVEHAYDTWMTYAEFMAWVAQERQDRNTRLVTCPMTGNVTRVSTRRLSK